jgi:hypothetical protein
MIISEGNKTILEEIEDFYLMIFNFKILLFLMYNIIYYNLIGDRL